MNAHTLCCSMLFVAMMLAGLPSGLSAKTLGMVADIADSVTVFDGDTHAVLGTVPITGGAISDVLITPDLKLGFVTSIDYQVHVIDLTVSPPALAGGTNPIPISNAGEDIAISPDGKYVVVSSNGSPEPLSVVNIATRTEVSTFSVPQPSGTTSVDVCSDNSVLVTSFDDQFSVGNVRRLTLSGTGTLTDTGKVLSVSNPNNVYCAPGAKSGLVVLFSGGGVKSFTIPGLSVVDTRPLSGIDGLSGAFNQGGTRVFVRSIDIGTGWVDGFAFNPTTGALGTTPCRRSR